ncbi:hypothetical protein DNTS_034016 [Danionella cerebrum]|uniref:Chemokine interleukin-8-like domain-containing protein n=1 Tax=Danionella cerebrum TaxID=2873325 RepID=A0A553QBL4_9TELE|nr:hypothetical protein DNTS_034016 [Danionella translucida]
MLLTILWTEGQPLTGRQRCLCQNNGVKMLNQTLIEKIEIFQRSPSCGRVEIIVTLKNKAGKRCLNSKSKLTHRILRVAKTSWKNLHLRSELKLFIP